MRRQASRVRCAAVIVAALAACSSSASPPEGLPALTVHGTELVLTTVDHRELRSAELVGATLAIGDVDVRLEGIDRDPSANERVVQHRFVAVDRQGRTSALCEPDAEGKRWAVPLLDDRGRVTLACSSGAIAKCIRWGYRPWPTWPGEPPRRALHEACIRMVRADYGGDGTPATRDGTRIAFCDRAGVHPCPANGRLEAAWSPSGATCVARPRVAELTTLQQLAARYPRLIGHLGADACTMLTAGSDDRAVVFSLRI